jgi:hypothetical protein
MSYNQAPLMRRRAGHGFSLFSLPPTNRLIRGQSAPHVSIVRHLLMTLPQFGRQYAEDVQMRV